MRLYRLISRTGQVRKGLTPWFKAPTPGAPARYHGWVWDPRSMEWIESPMARIRVDVPAPAFPKPTETPRPAQDFYVPGWFWDSTKNEWQEIPLNRIEIDLGYERGPKPGLEPGLEVLANPPGWSWSQQTHEWVATIIMASPVDFSAPRPFRPDYTEAGITVLTPIEREWQQFLILLINQGLNPTEARRVADGMRKTFWELAKARRQVAHTQLWQNYIETQGPNLNESINRIGATAVVIAVAAGVGYLIGTIMSRLAVGMDELETMAETQRTYLLGPDYWKYSRMISRTFEGTPFYSECEEIGTTWVRHRRGRGPGDIDVIDFPGGFIEEGYVFPMFVKYTWSHWTLRYVGMLSRQGANMYSLRKGDYDSGGLRRGQSIPADEWCAGFHWYL